MSQGSDWLLSKPTFLSQMAGWVDVLTGSKNNGLNQPKAQEPWHCTCHKKANNYAPPDTHVLRYKSVDRSWRTRPRIHSGTGVCKARFQGAASLCSRWPIASFMLPGLTNPVSLYPV